MFPEAWRMVYDAFYVRESARILRRSAEVERAAVERYRHPPLVDHYGRPVPPMGRPL